MTDRTAAAGGLAIEIAGLVKTFGPTRALDGLDLQVRQGDIMGLLGPNGSGKSTTIRVLLGLLRADSGTVRLLGGDPWKDVATLHRRLAYVPGDVNLWPTMSGGEVIDLLGRLRGGVDEAKRKDLLDRFDLDPRKKARAYSKGNRQKVALIAALASDVDLLMLDEPTAGLDPLMENEFRKAIAEEKHAGKTVLLSSHILSEVEHVCDRVSIIKAGRTVETGTLTELRHLTRTSVVATLGDGSIPDLGPLRTLPGVHDVALDGRRLSAQVETAAVGPLVGRLSALGLDALTATPPTLEELFLRHYGTAIDADEESPADASATASRWTRRGRT